MELEGYGEFPLSTNDIINHALDEHASQQALFFEAISILRQDPSEESGEMFNVASVAAQDTFELTVGIIASCDELSPRERSAYIAALCLGTEATRLDFMRDLVPEGEFQDTETSHELLSDMLEGWLEGGQEAVGLAQSVTENYAQNLNADIHEFLDHLSDPKKTGSYFLRELGKQTASAGKLTIAVAVGTILAQKFLKRQAG